MVLRIFETCAVVFSKSETTKRPDSKRARDSEIPHYWMSHSTGLFIYLLFIYRFVQCTGERTIGHVVPYLVHPPKKLRFKYAWHSI